MTLTRTFIHDSVAFLTNQRAIPYRKMPNVDCQLCKSSLKFKVFLLFSPEYFHREPR